MMIMLSWMVPGHTKSKPGMMFSATVNRSYNRNLFDISELLDLVRECGTSHLMPAADVLWWKSLLGRKYMKLKNIMEPNYLHLETFERIFTDGILVHRVFHVKFLVKHSATDSKSYYHDPYGPRYSYAVGKFQCRCDRATRHVCCTEPKLAFFILQLEGLPHLPTAPVLHSKQQVKHKTSKRVKGRGGVEQG